MNNTKELRFETILEEIQDDLDELSDTLSKLQQDVTDIAELVADLSCAYISTVRLLTDEIRRK